MMVNNSTLNVAGKTNEESVMRNLTNTTEQSNNGKSCYE